MQTAVPGSETARHRTKPSSLLSSDCSAESKVECFGLQSMLARTWSVRYEAESASMDEQPAFTVVDTV